MALAIVAFAAGFSALSVLRHEAFQSHAFDLGNMDQAAWNTIHGHLLRFTDMSNGGAVLTNRLAIHVEPLLALLSVLYLVHSGPETLLVTQACVVALGAVPAFLLARPALGSWPALAFPLAYLLHPSLQNAVLDDFHPVTLSACFLLWAIYFALRDSLLPFGLAGLLALSSKEDMGLLVGLLGLIFLIRRRWLAGSAVLVGGFVWFLVCVDVIIPHFNPGGSSPYVSRYAYLGHGLEGIASAAIHHPGTIVRVLTQPSPQAFLRDLLHPLGFTSILGFPLLLLALPSFVIDMLSSDPTMYSGFYQYGAEIVPYVVAASSLGAASVALFALRKRVRGARYVGWTLSGLALLASLVATYEYGFTPFAYGYVVPEPGAHQGLEQRLLRTIPRNAVVAASDEIEPHLSDRRTVYLLPTVHPRNGPPAQYIVLDASIPSLYESGSETAGRGPAVTASTLHRAVSHALASGYGVEVADDGVLILRRGIARKTLPRSFFRFAFAPPSHGAFLHVRWNGLNLVAVTVHPNNRFINRSRPAISLETYWRASRPLPPGVRVIFAVSPPYHGAHPSFSSRWIESADSPTIDWLPISDWPLGRTVHAASLPLLPDISAPASLDVAIRVTGAGEERDGRPIPGAKDAVLVATIHIGG